EYLKGPTLATYLRNCHKNNQLVPSHQVARLLKGLADALDYAHSQGVVHRDIKPENVLLSAGEAVVADFGIARAISEAAEGRLTGTGISLGTPAYMSPEQAMGETRIDGRTDIYALGCLLYEMLSGDAPYLASTPQAVLAKKLTEPSPRISVVRETVPPGIEAALVKAMAKAPADRYATAHQFVQALAAPAAPASERRRFPRRSLAVAVPAAVVLVAAGWVSVRAVRHRADVRWARDVALPQIERLIADNDVWRNLVPPYRLAERAEAILGPDSALTALFRQVAREIDVRTDPPGARVYLKEYQDPDAEWSLLGVTPLEDVRVPIGIFRWKLEKDGYEPVEAAASTWNVGGPDDIIGGSDLVRRLDQRGSLPPGMVRVSGAETPDGRVEDFFIGRYEVTNREYKAFVDAGGYDKRDYWKHPFVKDGRTLTWEEARREFVDRAGQPGPATWVGGDFPAGQADHPVSGVSWYEAAAYADFTGRSLPTAAHWNVARGGLTPMSRWPQLGGFGILAPFTNFGGQGPVPVGSLASLTAYGAYDMPGNVREWCWNETPQGRVVRGGSWEDNTYEFEHVRQAPAMDRSPRNGFRLAFYPDRDSLPGTLFGFHDLRMNVDLRARPPVPDAVYRIYAEQFSYDPKDLNARVEYRQESPGGWIREKVSFDAAYGNERVPAYLFLPAAGPPPYQTVVYFPGSASTWMPSSEGIERYYEFTMFLSFLVRNGRAVLLPIYRGTFERSTPELTAIAQPGQAHTYAYTEYLIQVVKDVRRSLDYLETRPDIDAERIAFYGMSWGGYLGAIVPAVERRFRASVLVAAGLLGLSRPETGDLTYVSRVRTPTLILNGKYDVLYPRETSAQPLFDLLGTPAADKRIIYYETDHIPPRVEFIKETLAWLDTYLGPVAR
ncbi:MAG TPA: SUMF1/EgtB/PvdO family nonheme iron enzyme, partial [Gemmatimonadales bacterium]|nr:SUMF1/EgtB/PvdO family nonheme iron enzyme [Gemmatimonadales bacterium]